MSREDTERVVCGLWAALRVVGLVSLSLVLGMIGAALLWMLAT